MAKLILVPVVAALLTGCGINREQLRTELESERRWTEQQQAQTLDQLRADMAGVTESTQQLAAELRRELGAAGTSLRSLQKDVDHLTSDVATIKAVAAAMQTTNNAGIERLKNMQKLHDEFLASVDTLDQKIQVSQEKYRDIIRKRIASLKEQYTYMHNLLRELESGTARAGDGNDDGDDGTGTGGK